MNHARMTDAEIERATAKEARELSNIRLHNFADEISNIYMGLACRQIPLDSELSKVWLDNIDSLYET